MRYLGSKRRIAKHILPIILKGRQPGQLYIEPFCGGCNSLDKVDGPRWGNDNNPYLIALLQSLQKGWIPPKEMSRELYSQIRSNPSQFPPDLVGFVGFPLSFGGKWFGGFMQTKPGYPRNYAVEVQSSVIKQVKLLKDVKFTNWDYRAVEPSSPAIIYCDPPYCGTTGYGTVGFDGEAFFEWCRNMAREGHSVFISEYAAPPDFELLLEIPTKTTLNKNKQSDDRIERLFTIRIP